MKRIQPFSLEIQYYNVGEFVVEFCKLFYLYITMSKIIRMEMHYLLVPIINKNQSAYEHKQLIGRKPMGVKKKYK